jgi:quinol monooxygenase YgiN
MSVTVGAFVRPNGEHVAAVRKALLEAVPAVRQEQGCELYSLHEGDKEFIFVERWASPEALQAHSTAQALRTMVGQIKDLLRGPLDVHTGIPLENGGLAGDSL